MNNLESVTPGRYAYYSTGTCLDLFLATTYTIDVAKEVLQQRKVTSKACQKTGIANAQQKLPDILGRM